MKPTIRYKDAAGQAVETPIDGDVLVIGREQDCGLVLDDPNVSKRHAQVIRVESEYIIRDQGSVNGTFVGEHRITHHTLKDGDVIRISKHELLFRAGEGADGALAVAAPETAAAVGVIEARPFAGAEWMEEKVADIRGREEARRRRISWALNFAIIGGIALILMLLLFMRTQGGEARNYGAVELETGYLQLVPLPVGYGYADVEVDAGGILEITEQDTPALKELAALDPRFVQVKPTGEGAARIAVRAAGGEKYYITVLVQKREVSQEKYAEEYAKAESIKVNPEKKAERAREWARSARAYLRERPFEAMEMARLAQAYAEGARLNLPELEMIMEEAQAQAKTRWKGLALRYSQSIKTSDLAQRQSVLEEMIMLIPDKKDPRRQWAQLRLERLKADIAKNSRRTFPFGG